MYLPSSQIVYRTSKIEGLDIFYREAGPKDAPVVLLLHGFPSSSFMFRNLIPDSPQAKLVKSSRMSPSTSSLTISILSQEQISIGLKSVSPFEIVAVAPGTNNRACPVRWTTGLFALKMSGSCRNQSPSRRRPQRKMAR